MATIIDDTSRTFHEYLLLPGLTKKEHSPANVTLRTPLQRYKVSQGPRLCLNVPLVSSAMQAVSGTELAIALAMKGGCAFIFCSQSIESQAEMVRTVKEYRAGFVQSDSNLPPTATLRDAVELRRRTGHSTIAITADGSGSSKLLGLLTSKDFWEFKDALTDPVSTHFTPVDKLVLGREGISLQEATELLWKNKKECLPIIDQRGNLRSLVFRRDYFDSKSNPEQVTDSEKRFLVGAAINTHDYKERAKALVDAGADALVIDSSDGHTEWQAECLRQLRSALGDTVAIGAGNVVTGEGFRYLADAGADFVKVGIGGGSICITREQKGIGRGQASALMEVVAERERYIKDTGMYVPVCSDGAIDNDTHIIVALAMGADLVMMGKYFAMTEESPPERITYRGRLYKPYWGEGSNRARNWQRYNEGSKEGWLFEEGVDAYVPYSGPLGPKVAVTTSKVRATMCNCGATDLRKFFQEARLTRISPMTLIESGTSTVEQLDRIQRAD